ncbi:RNA chaperone Hfq [Pseudomonas carnis]|jgi:sRNA-binding regulator protein Hfq|nr:RNA chaperone Hfq [Pseudomonas carnis]MBP5948049.1 RNA chaperone Hfq [Pseudomonas sp. P9(2020)]
MPTKKSMPVLAAKGSQRVTYAAETTVDRTTREQYRFLDYCVAQNIECHLFSITGARFSGVIHEHDRETMLFGGRSPRLIKKSFVALIVPKETVELFAEYRGMGTALQRKRAKQNRKRGRKEASAQMRRVKKGSRPKTHRTTAS